MTKRLLSVWQRRWLSQSRLPPAAARPRQQPAAARPSSPLVGAGSTLVAPLMSKWQSDYASKTEEHGHLRRDRQRRRDRPDHLAHGRLRRLRRAADRQNSSKKPNGVEQIPWALSGTVPAYNVSGAPKNLKLSGEVLADIYLGKITSWDDPAIAKLNPGASLPSTKITPGLPQRRQRRHLRVHQLPLDDQPRIQVEGRHLDRGQVPDRRRRRKERRRRRGDLARPTARSATSASPTRSPTNSACRWSKTRPGTSRNRAWKASKRPPTRSARSARTTKSRSPTCRPRPRARTRSRPTPT